MIKGFYKNSEDVRKLFKHQGSPDTCLQTSVFNVLNEFLDREKIDMKLSRKEIHKRLFRKGPFGQIALSDYTRHLSEMMKGEHVKSNEIYNQPSLIPVQDPKIRTTVDIERLSEFCSNTLTSFPYVTVSGRWFELFRVSSWCDPDNEHVIIIIDVDLDEQMIEFFDPAEKYMARSSKVGTIPKNINSDRFLSYWDESKIPRRVGWFERTQKSITEY